MTDESKKQPTKLEFEIFNLPFKLRAPDDEHERLRRAARHVDTVMRDLSNSQNTPDTAKIAMQTALLITVEYYKMIDDITTAHGLTDDVRQRVERLIQKLEKQLSNDSHESKRA
jgi:cell division protein ZapA